MKVEYSEDTRVAFFNGYKFRKDLKTGYYLSTKKTDIGRRERLHCYVWRYNNGAIPKGFHVHHANEDKGNNDIENLRCIKGRTHTKYHSSKKAVENYEDICKKLLERAVPKAAQWHGTAAGKAWHSQHAKETIANMKETRFVCNYCGKEFFRKPIWKSKYCSNNCKSGARRRSGVDNEMRQCPVCGGDFSVNKYSAQRCCSPRCGNQLSWDKKHQEMRGRACL